MSYHWLFTSVTQYFLAYFPRRLLKRNFSFDISIVLSRFMYQLFDAKGNIWRQDFTKACKREKKTLINGKLCFFRISIMTDVSVES